MKPSQVANMPSEIAALQFMDWQQLYETEKPFQLFIDIPADAPDQRKTNISFTPKAVEVSDVRGLENSLTLDTHGFKLARLVFERTLATTVDVETAYFAALKDLLQRELGEDLDRVFFFDWRVCIPPLLPKDKKRKRC